MQTLGGGGVKVMSLFCGDMDILWNCTIKRKMVLRGTVHVLIPLFFTTKCSTQSESKKAVMEKLEHWCMYSEGIVLCMRTAYLTNMPTA